MTYDIIIVGAGPAGLTAAIYARRANKSVLVIERALYGGQMATIGEVENYPGFENIQGAELSQIFYSQAKKLGVKFVRDVMLALQEDGLLVHCKKADYRAKSVILSLGSTTRELNVDGEKQFVGQGVSYCATCDGNFFKNKDVAIVGGGDSAIATALYLKPICKSVKLISKYSSLKMKAYTDQIFKRLEGVEFIYNEEVEKIKGNNSVESLVLTSGRDVKVDGVFVTIGRKPETQFLAETIKLDNRGYIVTDELMHTSCEGVFACGDVTTAAVKQIVTAAAGGAIAATEAIKYVATKA